MLQTKVVFNEIFSYLLREACLYPHKSTTERLEKFAINQVISMTCYTRIGGLQRLNAGKNIHFIRKCLKQKLFKLKFQPKKNNGNIPTCFSLG